jgi:cell division protein FtsB
MILLQAAQPEQQSVFQQYAVVFASLVSVAGGIGLATVNNWFANKKNKGDYQIALRSELREENMQLREENKELRDEIEDTRQKYLKSLEAIEELRGGKGVG